MTYTVKQGDSLSKIARDELGNMALWKDIAMLNHISNPNLIYPGQILKLPDVQVMVQSSTDSTSIGEWVAGGLLLLLVGVGIRKSLDKKKESK